jgi:hypothetical protein
LLQRYEKSPKWFINCRKNIEKERKKAFAAKKPHVLRQNRPAFCRRIQCVLPQNTMRFAAKCNALCRKTEINGAGS